MSERQTFPTGQSHGEIRYHDLDAQDCRAILRAQSFGRVAWQAVEGPNILGVPYVYWDEGILFRTSPYGAFARLGRSFAVAFEVDERNQGVGSGCTVVVRGVARRVVDADVLVGMRALGGLAPWAYGVNNIFLHVVSDEVTGRSVTSLS